jgi:O-antigen/teichoic acid export membrane protein
MKLRQLHKSSALRTAVAFGFAGVGFALGNLLLARALPPAQFGGFTLFLALVQIGASLAPIGLEGQVNRRPGSAVSPGRALLPSTLVALAVALFGWSQYRLGAGPVAALFVAVAAGGASFVASAVFQSRLRFGLALTLSQGLSAVLLLLGAFAVLAGGADPLLLAAIIAAYYVLSSGVGWGLLAREPARTGGEAHSYREGLSLLGITAAALILMQLERLLTPRLLGLEDLATFAVVATLVGSPFRMLQMGAGYTLLPRLSGAATAAERRRLVRHEAVAVGLIAVAGGAVTLVATPWIAHHLLAGKYLLSTALIVAALASGAIKLVDGFATTMVWALASARQLATLNWVSWICAVVGLGGAWIGSRWGLIGLMYGVTFGWVCRGAVAGALAGRLVGQRPAEREPAAARLAPSEPVS